MKEDSIKDIINDTHDFAQHCAGVPAPLLKFGIESIARRLETLVQHGFYVTPEAVRKFAEEQSKKDEGLLTPFGRTLKMPVISMPGKATIKYHADDPELPRLAAFIDTVKSDDGKASCDCTIFVGKEVLADMRVYRGQHFALALVRQALKGAMSRLGKHRRLTANRRKKEGK